MSVIVKGMKFPENCLKCDLRSYDANAGEEYCPFTQVECLRIGRQESCPLREIPEKHGRLIDADAFAERIKSIIKRQGYDDLEMDKFLTVGDVLNAVIADLKGMTLYGYEHTPTVIEAEGAEE